MTELVFDNNRIHIGDNVITTDYPILDAFSCAGKIVVLLDPDSYLKDPNYKAKRREGEKDYGNLQAYSREGIWLWSAEFPEESDYYHTIASRNPLIVHSFSSYICEIDLDDGSILDKEFTK